MGKKNDITRRCFKAILFFLILFLFPGGEVFSQITGNGHSAVDTTRIPSDTLGLRRDPVFIWCGTDDPLVKGSLTAVPPGGTAGWDFTWRMFDPVAFAYDSVVKSESGVSQSTASGLTGGGYAVRIRDGASYDTVLYAWVMIDTLHVSIAIQQNKCKRLALSREVTLTPFYYYDPADSSAVPLTNGYEVLWTSNPHSPIPYPEIDENPKVTFSPPYEDTWYYLEVADSFGCSSKAQVFVETIQVKADFEIDPDKGEAPLEVDFTNKSLNAESFFWDFGDSTYSELETPETHTYYIPNTPSFPYYLIKLTANGKKFPGGRCTDTITRKVVVEPSALEIPNVFTPNGDSYNDYFRVYGKSLKYLHMKVFNRLGYKIYDWQGGSEEMKDWLGWDGKINGHGEASPGVYYYVIRAVGWDDVRYEGKLYRGTVYLFREKK